VVERAEISAGMLGISVGRVARLAAAAVVLLVVACSKGGAPSGAGRTVRFAIAKDPGSLNPLFLHPDAASVELQLARLSFEPFVDLDASAKPVPALLDRVPTVENGGVSPDGRTIVYHLRRGVRWSDGAPVTSADVLFTLRAILDPRNPVRSTQGYDLIDRAVARDASTIAFHLRRAWAPAATSYFSSGTTQQFVLPEHVFASQGSLVQSTFNADPSVGDGPYSFVSWQRGDSLTYRANARYWRGKPEIETLDIRIVTDPGTNLVMLRSGTLDWNLMAPVQYATVEDDPRFAFSTVSTAVIAGLVFNTTHVPLDDVRVRRAIAMSIDRRAISAKITLGKYPVTNMLQPQFSWAYDRSIRQPGYDPRGADALFDAAGWARGGDGFRRHNGVALHLNYVQFPESMTGVRVATLVQAELRERGVDATVKSVTNAQLFLPKSGTLTEGNFDLAYVPFTMGGDPDDSYVLRCEAPSNYMRWCNPQVDALEAEALKSVSQSERKRAYSRIGEIVAQEVPVLYLFDADYIYARRRELSGFAPNAFLPTWNAWAWKM
jgi:peptide/nickel transport system substrate-binding protein